MSNISQGGIWDLSEDEGIIETEELIDSSSLTVKIECDFTTDTATCYISTSEGYKQIGTPHKLRFRLDHFTGCRFALSCFSTISTGGTAVFNHFVIARQVTL